MDRRASLLRPRILGKLVAFALCLVSAQWVTAQDASSNRETDGLIPMFSDGFESGDYFDWSEAITGDTDRTPSLPTSLRH